MVTVSFDGVENIVADPLRFKARLRIGEDAYFSIRAKKAVFEAWDVLGVASTGATVAKSAFIATRFFEVSTFWTSIGIGTATATTPIGWVIAASVISGGAWYGLSRYLKSMDTGRVTVVPEFINTPLDVLGLGLFDLMAPLAMKVANIDGTIHEDEEVSIRDYFVREWGYDPMFVDRGLEFVRIHLDEHSVQDLAETLAAFQKENPDCNFSAMSKEILGFLEQVMHADGRIDEREEMAIEKIRAVFREAGSLSVTRTLRSGWEQITKTASEAVPDIKAPTLPNIQLPRLPSMRWRKTDGDGDKT